MQTANRVRRAISEMLVETGEFSRQVTVSIGIGTFDGRIRSSAEELRRRANKALHQAKGHGKDQVWLHSAADGDDPPRPRPEGSSESAAAGGAAGTAAEEARD